MSKKQLLTVWMLGLILCIITIMTLKMVEDNVYAYVFTLAVMAGLSLLKDKDGKDLLNYVKEFIAK